MSVLFYCFFICLSFFIDNSVEIQALGNTLQAFDDYSDKIEFRKVQQKFQTGSSLKPTFDVTNYTIGSIKL